MVWGIALVMMGIMVLFRIPELIPRIEKIGDFSRSLGFIKFCFYFMAAMLIAGGAKKLHRQFVDPKKEAE